MVKKLINGMVFGTGICIVVGVFMMGIYFVKGTDPLIATDGETLTAAKWNALVSESQGRKYVSNWINVSTSSTAPGDGVAVGNWNEYTVTHGLNTQNVIVSVLAKCSDGVTHQANSINFYYKDSWTASGYMVRITDNNEIVVRTPNLSSRTYRYIAQACSTTGQYKVIVTAND